MVAGVWTGSVLTVGAHQYPIAGYEEVVRTWQRQCAQWDRLGDRGLLRSLGDPWRFVPVRRNVRRHLRFGFVRLPRRKTWVVFVLDIITIAKAAVYSGYGYEQSDDRGEMERWEFLPIG